jgi:hypothetical protein
MILKPQDIVILLKLLTKGDEQWSYASLADELFMSASEIHAGIRRSVAARLMDMRTRQPIKKSLEEFLVHGLKYAYPPQRGSLTRGIPTSYAAPPLKNLILNSNDPPPVWPDPDGEIRGYELSPLYKSVPKAASKDKKLYELLALVDAIRDGRTRERELASQEIKKRVSPDE